MDLSKKIAIGVGSVILGLVLESATQPNFNNNLPLREELKQDCIYFPKEQIVHREVNYSKYI